MTKLQSGEVVQNILDDVEVLVKKNISTFIPLNIPTECLKEILEILFNPNLQVLEENAREDLFNLYMFSLYEWEISQKYCRFTILMSCLIGGFSSINCQSTLEVLRETLKIHFPNKLEEIVECYSDIQKKFEEN